MIHQDRRDQARRSDDISAPNPPKDRRRPGEDERALETSEGQASGASRPSSIAPTAMTPTIRDKTYPDGTAVFLRIAALGLIGAAAIVAAIYSGNGRHPSGAANTRVTAPMTFAGAELRDELRRLQRSYSDSSDRVASWRGHSGMFTAFDMAEAETALSEAQQQAAACAVGDVSRSADIKVHVVIGRTGQAVYVHTPDRDRLGDEVADCIEDRFRAIAMSPFEGQDVSLTRRFAIPQ